MCRPRRRGRRLRASRYCRHREQQEQASQYTYSFFHSRPPQILIMRLFSSRLVFNSRLVSTGSSYGWYPVEAVDHGRRLGRQTTFPGLGIYTALGSGGRSDPFTAAASDASPPKDGEENAWTIMFRTAYKTNSLTACSPSLLMMLLRCVSAVFTLRFSTEATSLVLFPSASNWTTCFSRLVSVSFSADRRWPRRSWRNTA